MRKTEEMAPVRDMRKTREMAPVMEKTTAPMRGEPTAPVEPDVQNPARCIYIN
jgi:hypothetical protein